jgi:hypothetical protein
MRAGTRHGRWALAVAVAMSAAGGWLIGAGPAHASFENCANEGNILTGGDDFSVNVGPGVLFLGIDKGDQGNGLPDPTAQIIVCAESDTLGFDVAARIDRGDVPRLVPGTSCLLSVDGTCRANGFKIVFDDGDTSGLVIVENHDVRLVDQGVPIHCVGVGEPCP